MIPEFELSSLLIFQLKNPCSPKMVPQFRKTSILFSQGFMDFFCVGNTERKGKTVAMRSGPPCSIGVH